MKIDVHMNPLQFHVLVVSMYLEWLLKLTGHFSVPTVELRPAPRP